MTTIRLRNAASFSLRWLRDHPQHSVPVALLALYLGVWLIAPRHRPHSVAPLVAPSVSNPAPLPPPVAADTSEAPLDLSMREQPTVGYTKTRTLRFREGRDKWRVEFWSDGNYNRGRVKFYRDRRFIYEQDGDPYLFLGILPFKSRFPVVALRTGGFSAVGQTTRFYTLRRGTISLLLEMDSWNHGPYFQNYDHDGNPEWVTDDYDFNYSENPWGDHLYIHKLQPNGDLKAISVLPNTGHRLTANSIPCGDVRWLN